MNILLVEDHDNTRGAVAGMFARWGFRFSAAKNLAEALALVKEEAFDVIVSDIALPDGTGYALISEVRRAGVKAVCIAISGYPFPEEVYEPKVTGFDYHLRKPIDPDQFHLLLDRLQNEEAPRAQVT